MFHSWGQPGRRLNTALQPLAWHSVNTGLRLSARQQPRHQIPSVAKKRNRRWGAAPTMRGWHLVSRSRTITDNTSKSGWSTAPWMPASGPYLPIATENNVVKKNRAVWNKGRRYDSHEGRHKYRSAMKRSEGGIFLRKLCRGKGVGREYP